MSGNLHKHLSEVKGWKHERKHVVGGRHEYAYARRQYNRACRREGRRASRS
jgi:hypothetical protein